MKPSIGSSCLSQDGGRSEKGFARPQMGMITTPQFVYSVESYDGNAARMKVGEWMRKTRLQRCGFDLQALESNDGACQQEAFGAFALKIEIPPLTQATSMA